MEFKIHSSLQLENSNEYVTSPLLPSSGSLARNVNTVVPRGVSSGMSSVYCDLEKVGVLSLRSITSTLNLKMAKRAPAAPLVSSAWITRVYADVVS